MLIDKEGARLSRHRGKERVTNFRTAHVLVDVTKDATDLTPCTAGLFSYRPNPGIADNLVYHSVSLKLVISKGGRSSGNGSRGKFFPRGAHS